MGISGPHTPLHSRSSPDVIVIGAGIAGVTTARELTRAGLRVAVLEARLRLGGRIHTIRDFCSQPVEAGAEFIHGTHARTWPEVRAAGLSARPSPHTRDALIDVGQGARTLPQSLAHPEVWPALTILRRLARTGPGDQSARDFIERHGYRGRARLLAEMVLSSHLPGDIDEIGVGGFVSDGVLELETGVDYRVNEGYDRLVEHVARELDIEYGVTVESVEWAPDGVMIRAHDGQYRSARAAVVTLPAGVLQSGAVSFIPELPESKRIALRQMVMGPVLKMILRFAEPFWPKRLSAVFCGVGPVTVYWNISYRAAHALPILTAYCTGARASALGHVSEDEAVALVLEDLHRHFPRAMPKIVAWRRVDWSIDPLARGGYSFLRPFGVGARGRLAAADTGALFWAGSETATQTIAATVEGAYTSGLRAAREVLRALG